MLQQHRDGVFDCMWSQPYALPAVVTHVSNGAEQSLTSDATAVIKAKAPSGGAAGASKASATAAAAAAAVVLDLEPIVAMSPVGDVALAADAKATRAALVDQAKNLLPKVSALCSSAGAGGVPSTKFLQYACLALVEAYGRHRPASAAMWLLSLQGMQSSIWLRSVWREYALNPTNAVAASLSRLEELNQRTWPKKTQIQQILAEKEFLSTSSVAYKRYLFLAIASKY
jgi:hypothetical protein